MIEYTIPTILRVAKSSDSVRLANRVGYSNFKLKSIDSNDLKSKGHLTMTFSIPKGYQATVKILDYKLYYDIYFQKSDNIYRAINDALDWSLKNADVEVDCDCPDFKYRYAYVASQKGYKFGDQETRPASKTNPKNKGRVCKHILAILMRPSNYRGQLESMLVKLLK